MSSISKEDKKAKMEFIRAFFDDFDIKTGYLEKLYESGHRDEARTLCSCYIDSLASALYWPDDRSKFNFVRVLREHSGEDIFSHIHPKQLYESVRKLSIRRSNKWVRIHASISGVLQDADRRLYNEREVTDLLVSLLDKSQIKDIELELWRGTFAAIVYDQFRIASVHGFGAPDGITFDGMTFQGRSVPAIDFPIVYECLKKVVAVVRELSEKTGRWFGHDYK